MVPCAVLLLLSAFQSTVLAHTCRDISESKHTSQAELQQDASSDCTHPRTAKDVKLPFCFVPSTISVQAQQFLSQTSTASASWGDLTWGTDPVQQAATAAQIRPLILTVFASHSRIAEARHIQSMHNGSVGDVPVLYAVPKGVKAALRADTKVLLYLHGKCCVLQTSL
jgi:hypothetical protein